VERKLALTGVERAVDIVKYNDVVTAKVWGAQAAGLLVFGC
jgi:hypothetical protein